MLTIASASAAADAVEISCPGALDQAAITLKDGPAGWRFHAASPVYLHSAAPMATPPEGLGHLIEDSRRKRNNEEIYTYRLEGAYPEGKWLQCAYGEYNQLTLSQRLPDATKRCTVAYTKGDKAGQNKLRIICE